MRQDQDIQYTLLSIRWLIHSDRMRRDAISESMIQVLYCRAVSCCEMYCIGYSLFNNLVCITACLYITVQYCSHCNLVYIFYLELLL